MHALVHEAVVATLVKSKRQALHRRAAGWFADRDAAVEAEHLNAAADAGAAEVYLRAARLDVERHRVERPLELIERGLDLAAEGVCASRCSS